MQTVISFALVVVFAIVIALVMAFPTMWLWNYLMPTIFGLTSITWKQALAMNLLSSLLFKGSTSSSK